jgi:ATP-dependent helicase/nuclease subunit B
MVVVSERAQVRLDAARAWLDARPPTEPCLVVGATMEAANQIVRARLESTGVLFGTHRLTLGALTSILAGPELAREGQAVLGGLSTLAVVTRVVHQHPGSLGRFEPVRDRAGLPRALVATIEDLRMAAIDPASVQAIDLDLAALYASYVRAIAELRLADKARVLDVATRAVEDATSPLVGIPVLLLDLEIHTLVERRFIDALRARARTSLATAAAGDDRTIVALSGEAHTGGTLPATSLARVQRFLFEPDAGPPMKDDGTVTVLSAPGEGRECVEVARELLAAAARGIPFDRMAVLLHAPAAYRVRLAEVLRRAGIPAAFAEATRAPDPAGRAFLALLACKADGLSAVRFAEYLSLGEVPEAQLDGAPPIATADTVPPADERMAARLPASVQLSLFERPVATKPSDPRARPVIDGMLRVPRLWERLIVDAAVIGGRDRWRRRLGGLRKHLELELERAKLEDAPSQDVFTENLYALGTLTAFALPLLDDLDALPISATWGDWCAALAALASRALRDPERVQAVLAELAPMAEVGPVTLGQVRHVLGRRLTDLLRPPPRRTEGSVFVGTTNHARGRSFEVVAVVGLAERVFPQKILEDTVLVDAQRRRLSRDLTTNDDRVKAERLSLRLAAGAASGSLVVTYPRLDADRERPRVPSFYCLEVSSVVHGQLPDLEHFARESAARAGAAAVGWPAPRSTDAAIDDAEYDLVVLGGIFGRAKSSEGSARYLVEVNAHLYRSLVARHQRWTSSWTAADGLLKLSDEAKASLGSFAPSVRAYSPSALQAYAECPYRFYLSALLKLAPWEIPATIDQMPAAERGTLIHEVLFRFLGAMRDTRRLPITDLPGAAQTLDAILDEVARRFEDDLAPAIPRVWQDELLLVRTDLHLWLAGVAAEREWAPSRFELSFGLPHHGERDASSVPDPVAIEAGLRLRGSMDLVERADDGRLRVTDYKTGKALDKRELVVNGGRTVQPALYALVLEKLFPDAPVAGGRLYYCTSRGGFEERVVPLDDRARHGATVLARAVREDLAEGRLPAAPASGACRWCDYRSICGSAEEARTAPKQRRLGPALQELRTLP